MDDLEMRIDQPELTLEVDRSRLFATRATIYLSRLHVRITYMGGRG